MDSSGVIFDRDSAERIAAAVRRVEQTVSNAKPISQRNKNQSGHDARPIGFGVTATNQDHPVYPEGCTDTYVVKKQEWFFDEVPGLQQVTKLDRTEYVVAHYAVDGDDGLSVLPEGTAVVLWQVATRKGQRYWFVPLELASCTSPGSSSEPPSPPSSPPSSSSSSPPSSPPSSESSSESSSPPSSSESSEPPSSPPSSSESSESSEPPSSPPSSSSSESSSESSSPSPPSSESSEPPSSPPSPPPSSPPSPPPPPSSETSSDKDTAIVPAAWSPTGYVALFVQEAPEVRFDDVLTVTVDGSCYLTIDPKFVDVCEPGSIQVCGCVPDMPVLVGAAVQDDRIRVTLGMRETPEPVRLVIRLTGIRKGFAGHRFPDRTREQFLANERFLQSAYPGAGR